MEQLLVETTEVYQILVGKFKLKGYMLLKHSGYGDTQSTMPNAAFDQAPQSVALTDHPSLRGSKTCCMSLADNLSAFEGDSVEISSAAQGCVLNFESPSTL